MGKLFSESICANRYNEIPVGKYLLITIKKRGALKSFECFDDVNVGNIFGKIDIDRNLKTIIPDTDPKKEDDGLKRRAGIRLFNCIKEDMKRLSETCSDGSGIFDKVNVFVGISQLSSEPAKRLGFTIENIPDTNKLKSFIQIQSSGISKNKKREVKIAYITKEKLLEEYHKGTYDEIPKKK